MAEDVSCFTPLYPMEWKSKMHSAFAQLFFVGLSFCKHPPFACQPDVAG